MELNVVFQDSQGHTPRMCHSFNYKNDTGFKPSLSSTMELRKNDKCMCIYVCLCECVCVWV
jgi:hypothetical protein